MISALGGYSAKNYALILATPGLLAGGNTSRVVINKTQRHEIVPKGTAHAPRRKCPGTNLSRPDVMRKKTGTAYEIYNPMTEELQNVDKYVRSEYKWRMKRHYTYPAREVKAAAENPSKPQIAAQAWKAIISILPPSKSRDGPYHHKPHSVDRCLSVRVHLTPETGSRKRVISCESVDHAGSVYALSCAGHKLIARQ